MITIIIVAFVLISLFATIKYHNEVRNANIDNGGLRKSFDYFTQYLDQYYQMQFDADTGRYFSYSKVLKVSGNNHGKLFIGVKLSIQHEPILFTKFKNEYRGEYHGMDVSGINLNNKDSIDRCIKISLEKLKTEGILDYFNNYN